MFFILTCVVVGYTQMTQSSALVQGYMNKKVQLLDQIIERTDELKRLHELFPHDGSPSEQAVYCRDKLKEQMLAVREVTDPADKVVTARPLRRRRATTFLPAVVDMRFMNPCTRER